MAAIGLLGVVPGLVLPETAGTDKVCPKDLKTSYFLGGVNFTSC